MANGINKLARVLDDRAKKLDDKPPILDFGTIQDDMSLVTNKFPRPIPYEDYVICRSVCYDPLIPLTMTWWQDEGWNKQTSTPTDWQSGDPDKGMNNKAQPQEWTIAGEPEKWLNRWGELLPANANWRQKHQSPPFSGNDHMHNSKGEHSHEEDPDGKHYHDVYLPRKMYRIQPGDRVLVAWVGDDAVVIDIVMKATEMM